MSAPIETIGNVDTWAQFGLGGVVIFALFALIIYLLREQRTSRTEFITFLQRVTDMQDERQKETNAAINGLSLVIERNTHGCNK